MSHLTARQSRFVDEYLLDLNATQAAIRAGYSQKSAGRHAHDLLKKTQVLKALESAQKARGARVLRNADNVLGDINRLTREAWEAGDYKTALKGLELEGKHLGLFREKVESENITKIIMEWGE